MKHIRKKLLSTIRLSAVSGAAALSFATSAGAATYYIDIVMSDRVYDFETETNRTSVDPAGPYAARLTGQVETSGLGHLDDVLLSWSFTMQDQNSSNTISSEGLLAGSLGLLETGELSRLEATATGLYSTGGNWYFQETVREPGDYFVGFVSSEFGDLRFQDLRQSVPGQSGRFGASAWEYDFFDTQVPVLFGSTTMPVTPEPMAAVPLPAGLPLLAVGLGAFGFFRSNRKQR